MPEAMTNVVPTRRENSHIKALLEDREGHKILEAKRLSAGCTRSEQTFSLKMDLCPRRSRDLARIKNCGARSKEVRLL